MIPQDSVSPAHEAASPAALVVEDNALVAETVADGLGRLGYPSVKKAGSVEAALKVVDGDTIDMAVVETSVKSRSTEAVLDALDAKEIPAVIVTTSTDERAKARTAPKLYKPFGFTMLRDAVEMAQELAAVRQWRRTP